MSSFVWDYFVKSDDGTTARCNKCNSVIVCKGVTSTLIRHLKTRHSIEKPPDKDNNDEEQPAKRFKQQTLSFPTVNKMTPNEAFAELLCKDGFTANQVRKSRIIKKGLAAENIQLPKSNNTIMKHVHDFCTEKQKELRTVLQREKQIGKKWSLSFDEWTSKRGRRYLNISLHGNVRIDCLGMIRVIGSLTSVRTEQLIKSKLTEFGLDYNNDIVAIIGDGAAVNCKFMRNSGLEYQVCMDHGIHLAVSGSLYKNIPKLDTEAYDTPLEGNRDQNDEDDNYSEDSDDDFTSDIDETDEERGDTDSEQEELININLKDSINAVRKIVMLFKRSDLQNQYLQEAVIEKFGHEIKLKLDVKTR